MSEKEPYALDSAEVRRRYAEGARLHIDFALPPSQNLAEHEDAFDAWLAAHDAQVARDAAREALDGLARKARADWHPHYCGWVGAVDDYRDAHYPEESTHV